MRVLYIASDTPMTGGATKSFLAMLRQAKKAGIKFEVVCPDEKGLTVYLRQRNVKVHVVPYRHAILPPVGNIKNIVKWVPRLFHNTWLMLMAIKYVEKVAKEFGTDIIHENSSVLNIGYQVAKRLKIPDVIHIREYGDLDFNMIIPGIHRRLSSSVTYTISITKDIALHRNQHEGQHAIQLYNGIIQSSSIRYNAIKHPYFLFAGRIEPAKGVSELIDAYIKYACESKSPLALKLAGRCNYPGYLEKEKRRVESAGLGDLVYWLGEVNDIDDLMFEATATIIPSRFEGLGRVLPEAMANGSLCVGKYTGGTKEQIDNGKAFTGGKIAFSFDSSDELTGILAYITNKTSSDNPFEESGEFREMIRRSQDAVVEFFSEERFGEKLIEFYRRIMSEHNI